MCKLAPTGYFRVKWKEARTPGASIEVGGGSRCWLGSSDLTAALFKTLIMELGKFYFRYIKLIYIFVYFAVLQS